MKNILFIQVGIMYQQSVYRLNMSTATLTNTATQVPVTYLGIRARNNDIENNNIKSQKIPFTLPTYVNIINNESVNYCGTGYWKNIDMQRYRLHVSEDIQRFQLYDTTTSTFVYMVTVIDGCIVCPITAPIEYIFAMSKLTAHYSVPVNITYINTTYAKVEYGL